MSDMRTGLEKTVQELCAVIDELKKEARHMPLVSAEELAWALDTHVDFAQAVLDRIRARQRREPYVPPLPVHLLAQRINRGREGPPREPTLDMMRAANAVHRPGWDIQWGTVWTTMYDAWTKLLAQEVTSNAQDGRR